MNMEQWKERYPEQFAILRSTNEGRYALEEYDGVSSISIYATTPAMTEDFEYLTIFQYLTTLTIVHPMRHDDIQRTIHLGCNLHKNRMLKVLTVFFSVSSFHEDFALVAPQLTKLEIFGKIDLHNVKWNFNNLHTLHVGKLGYVGTTDFKWCEDAPVLKNLTFTSMDMSKLKSSSISTSVEALSLFDCDISDITMLKKLSNLKEVAFSNTNFRKFPMGISSMKKLVKIKINNLVERGMRFSNEFADEIVLGSAFSHVKLIDLDEAGVQKLTIRAAGIRKFDIRQILIRNSSSFDSTISPCNLSIDDPNRQIRLLRRVHVSGTQFLDVLLRQNALSDYRGGFILSDEWKRTHRQFDAEYFLVEDASDARAEILFQLRNYNPTVPFINMEDLEGSSEEAEAEEWEEPGEQDVEDTRLLEEDMFATKERYNHDQYARRVRLHARETPYFCVYTPALQSTFGVDPFDPALKLECNMCFDLFVKEEHDDNADTSTAFVHLPIDNPVPTNRSVVFCNLTEHDAARAWDGDATERIALHLKPNHLFHLDCFQRWVRAAILRDTVPDCAINHDKFYREN